MFYAEIQEGRQKWWENDFCGKTPIEYAGTLRVKNFVEKFLACFISKINTFYAKIQDGRQKWWGKDFFFYIYFFLISAIYNEWKRFPEARVFHFRYL